jgi:hypothetical protein
MMLSLLMGLLPTVWDGFDLLALALVFAVFFPLFFPFFPFLPFFIPFLCVARFWFCITGVIAVVSAGCTSGASAYIYL